MRKIKKVEKNYPIIVKMVTYCEKRFLATRQRSLSIVITEQLKTNSRPLTELNIDHPSSLCLHGTVVAYAQIQQVKLI
jgi:hypothetical protein